MSRVTKGIRKARGTHSFRIRRKERGDGWARAGSRIRQGAQGGSRAFRPEHQGDHRRSEAPASGARQQAGRVGEDRDGARSQEGRVGFGPSRGCRNLHVRFPHNPFPRRGLHTGCLPLTVGLGSDRQWYTAAGRWDTRRGRRRHTEEAGSHAPPDDPYPSAEHQLDKGAVEVMSEIPERIEREMFEIRSRMAPDVRDLKKHAEPQVIVKRTSTKVKERVRDAVIRFGKSLKESASRQAKMVGEAGRNRNPAPLTDAVKSDPRPLILLAISLAVTLMAVRKISNGREE